MARRKTARRAPAPTRPRRERAAPVSAAEAAREDAGPLRGFTRRLDEILSNSGVVLFEQDRALRYTWASNASWGGGGTMIGRTDKELVGDTAQVRALARLKRRVLRTGQPVREELRFDFAKGAEIYDLSLEAVRDGRGRVTGLSGVAVDCTRRRLLEDDLTVIQSFLAGLVEAMPAPIYVNGRDGRTLLVNRAWEQSTRVNRADGLGKSIKDLFPPARAARYEREMRRVLRTGLPLVNDEPPDPGTGGRHYHTVKFPIMGPDGRVNAVGGVSLDVTDSLRTRDELHESRQRLALLVERMPVGLIVWGVDRRAREWNPAAEAIFGYTAEEAVRMDPWALVPEGARDAVRAVWKGLETGSGGERSRNYNLRKDGRLILCEWFNTSLRGSDGRIVGVASMVRDVTEEHEARSELDRYRNHLEELIRERTAQLEASGERLRQAERLAALGTLAAGLGHDINNLLLPMRLAVDGFGTERPPPPAELAIMRRSLEVLTQLATGLVSLAAVPDEGAAPRQPVRLEDWWASDGPMLTAMLPPTVRLRVDLPKDLPPLALAGHHLTRVVLNLFTNAVEAAPDGSVALWARRESGPEGERVAVGVTDNGPGMAAEVRRRAAEPFFTTKRRALSTGLGLSLVDAITRSAGGSIRVRSEPGEGTTVSLLIPVLTEHAAEAVGRRAICSVALTLADRRIAGFLSVWLAARGFHPITVSSGEPDSADLWMTDGSVVSHAFLAGYRDRRPDGRVLVCGDLHPIWSGERIHHVADPGDATALAETLRRAVPECD